MLAKTSAASPGHVLRSLCGCGSMSILAFCPFFPPSLQSLHSAPFPPSLQSSVSSRRNGNACAMQCNRHNSADLSRKEREQTICLCSGPQSARTRQDKRRNAGGPIATSPHETTALRMSGLRLLTTPTRTTPCPVKSPPCRAALTAANHETLPPEPCHRHGATARHLPRRPCPASSSNSSARPAAQEARIDPSTRRPAPATAAFTSPAAPAAAPCPLPGPLRFRHLLAAPKSEPRPCGSQWQWQSSARASFMASGRPECCARPPLHVSVPSADRIHPLRRFPSLPLAPNY
jgi:hypothetical protein